MLLFICLTRKSMAAEEVPLSAVSEAITMLDRARYLIALSTPSLLKAFCYINDPVWRSEIKMPHNQRICGKSAGGGALRV